MAVATGVLYLGRVKRAPHHGDVYHYATIEPLVESDVNGIQWVRQVTDAIDRFPKRGFVHWHDAPLDLHIGSVWQFLVDEHPSAERGDRAEQFQLYDPLEPIEVLDLRAWIDESELRSAITGDGVSLSPAPLVRRILLWLASDVLVGPLLLKPGIEAGLWAVDAPEGHRDAARMPIHRLSTKQINRVLLDGVRWFLSPQAELWQSSGIQNWTSDAQVARSILSRLRKMDPAVVKAIGATENIFREYLEHVESGRMGSTDPAVERARADRLRGVRARIQRDVVLLSEAAETLLTTVPLRAEVERKVHAKVEEMVQAQQVEIDSALAAAAEQLVQVSAQVAAKRTQGTELDEVIDAKKREFDTIVASFEQEVIAKLEEFARRPEAVFAEAAVMRAVFAPHVGTSSADHHQASRVRHAPRSVTAEDHAPADPSNELCDAAAVSRALATHAGIGALSVYAMLSIHAAFVAGVVPVVTGARAYELLRAYASAITGGRLHWVPVPSSAMDPQDLLGRFDSASGRILPDASGLLDVIADARRSQRLHLVLLEGFNRAPAEAYLGPLLEVAEAGRTGDTARTIPIANQAFVSDDDPYCGLARLAWPSNVLIACLPTEGTATLPVPMSLWRFLALVDADDRDRNSTPSAPRDGNAAVNTEMDPALWKQYVAQADEAASAEMGDIASFAQALSLTERDASEASRFRGVLRLSKLPVADATALALTTTLIPRSTAATTTVEDALRAAGVAAPGWQTILAEAHRLRS